MFLTLSIGFISADSMTKLTYAQSNSLAQKGNSQAEQIKDQLQSSNQDNQILSGDSSILSGNNLQCQNQDNSKVSGQDCDSGISSGIVNALSASIELLIKYNRASPNLLLSIDQFNRDGDPVGNRITDTITPVQFSYPINLDRRTDSIILKIDGWPTYSTGSKVDWGVTNLSPNPLNCPSSYPYAQELRCAAEGLYAGSDIRASIRIDTY